MKKPFHYSLLTILLLVCFGVNAQSSQLSAGNLEEVWVAAENQSGVKVAYVHDKAETNNVYFVEFTNTTQEELTVEYSIFSNISSAETYKATESIILKSGETFVSSSQSGAILLGEGESYDDYSVFLTIK